MVCVKPRLTSLTSRGLMIEGAGPQLLADLLEEYENILRATSPAIANSLLPGRDREEIVRLFAVVDLQPPEELLVWWSWHDGSVPGIPTGIRNWPMSLKDSLDLRREDTFGSDFGQSRPEWIRVAGEANGSLSVSCGLEVPPLVRRVSTFSFGTQPHEIDNQVVSLCTPIAWWLQAHENGWIAFDPSAEIWKWDFRQFPREWLATDVV